MRDDFTEDVKRILAARVGAVCSNPDCRALTTGPQNDPAKAVNVGIAAHITGPAEGGPRYNPSLSRGSVAMPLMGFGSVQTAPHSSTRMSHDFLILRAWKTGRSIGLATPLGRQHPSARSLNLSEKRAESSLDSKFITLSQMNTGRAVTRGGPVRGSSQVQLLDCTEFFVKIGKTGQDSWSKSIHGQWNPGVEASSAGSAYAHRQRNSAQGCAEVTLPNSGSLQLTGFPATSR
jgi:hypothetical protein